MPRTSASVPESDPKAGSSEASSTSSPYVGESGPGFDPSAPVGAAEQADGAEQQLPEEGWTEETVAGWLREAGARAHDAFGVGEHDWEMTERDLERIAPAATRILNRYEPARKVAEYSDPAMVAYGMGIYGWRSVLERRAVLEAQRRDRRDTTAGVHVEDVEVDVEQPTTEFEQVEDATEIKLEIDPDFVPAADQIRRVRGEH